MAGSQRNLALIMLTLVATLSYVDRQILAVLVEPIRAEMQFTDTQFGALTGLAFGLFYAIMGLPMAMLADRWHRIRLVAMACTVWSCFTGQSGAAQNFVHLALARFGVGLGEAGGTAPSLSVLADYYPPARRPLIIGIFTSSGPVGVLIGAMFGAWAVTHYDWRWAFYALGVFGVILGPLLWLVVREPERTRDVNAANADMALPLSQCLNLFVSRRSLGWLLIACAMSAFVSQAMLAWIPAFLMRTLDMPMTAIGTWFAFAAGGAMTLGMVGGGALVNYTARHSFRAYAWVPMCAFAILAPTFSLALLANSWQVSLALMVIPMICCTSFVAPGLALIANLTPSRARATASAVLLLTFNIVGMALGPFVVGLMSDWFAASAGSASLRYALLAMMPWALLAALAQWQVSRHVEKDLSAVSGN